MSNNPFAEPNDDERTIFRPRPGGAAAGSAAAAPLPGAYAPPSPSDVPQTGSNPLLAAAAPILAAAVRIGGLRGQVPDPDQLRRRMVDAVRAFETSGLATGLDTKALRAARYALCATVDDLVLNAPGGSTSSWVAQSLTSIFHNEVTGGERFFEILEQMQREMGRYIDVVELMYVCIAIGFEGRYRVMQRGAAALADLRESVHRAIRNHRGTFERDLSPHWRGLNLGHKPISQRVPLWGIGLATLVLTCLIYLGFNFSIAGQSDVAFAELSALPPMATPAIPRLAPVPPPPPFTPPPGKTPGFASKLRQFLAPEIKQGLVTVLDDAQTVTVRLTNRNMFASGSAELAASYQPLIGRIGVALQDEQGQVMVNGYTDNQPIHSPRFPSNYELSRARAEAVAGLIRAKLTDPARVHVQGKAAAEPLAPNTTPVGRQQNRRTEIVLLRRESWP
jgi:type VI secretion system protein ImpK